MSSDYSNSKIALGDAFPEHRIDSDFARTEPLLNPDQLKSRFLFGVPLVSAIVNPITRRADVMTDDMLKDYIIRAVAKVEALVGIDVFPVKYREKLAFDRSLYVQFMYMKTRRKPILSVDKLSIQPANGVDIYAFPPDWIEPANFQRGQINVIPLQSANGNAVLPQSTGSGGAAYLSAYGSFSWVPAYWLVEYTAGFSDGAIPKILNELIGGLAAIDVLSMIASTYRSSSHSTSIDGMSQSVSGPGPQVFDGRIKILTEQNEKYIQKIKGMYSLKFSSSNL